MPIAAQAIAVCANRLGVGTAVRTAVTGVEAIIRGNDPDLVSSVAKAQILADGKSNAEIGRDLFVSEDTVKTHARRLFRKLGARDRAHAVTSGFRSGLLMN
jgi:hypothetical protein